MLWRRLPSPSQLRLAPWGRIASPCRLSTLPRLQLAGRRDEHNNSSRGVVGAGPQSSKKPKPTSVFQALFPGEKWGSHIPNREKAPVVVSPGAAAARDLNRDGPDRVSLRDEFPAWVDEPVEERGDKSSPGLASQPQPHEEVRQASGSGAQPVVLVLSSASPSLLESDFYRLAPQGQHVDGWAGGMMKVVQARHPTTYEPQGQYFIFFDSEAAALAYADEARRLHRLAQHHAFGLHHRRARTWSGTTMPTPPSSQADAAGLRAYALAPPSATLDLRPRMADSVSVRRAAATGAGNGGNFIRDLFRDSSDADEPTGAAAQKHHHQVLVRLEGSRLSAADLDGAIRQDGRERGMAWQLRADDGIVPLGVLLSRTPSISNHPPGEGAGEELGGAIEGDGKEEEKAGKRQFENGAPPAERFSRYMLSFTDPVEARRFVRGWHRREIHGGGRAVMVNATALW